MVKGPYHRSLMVRQVHLILFIHHDDSPKRNMANIHVHIHFGYPFHKFSMSCLINFRWMAFSKGIHLFKHVLLIKEFSEMMIFMHIIWLLTITINLIQNWNEKVVMLFYTLHSTYELLQDSEHSSWQKLIHISVDLPFIIGEVWFAEIL